MNPRTRAEFKDYCLRKLGQPVIEINIDDDQVDDRIDDALQYFEDYHFDGVEKVYLKHTITAQDIERRYLYVPDVIRGITGIFPIDDSASNVNMFDLRYQLRLHDLYDFTSVSYVSYEITMQHLRTLSLLFAGTPQIRYTRHSSRLMLDINWTSDIGVGSWVVIECYRALNPDTITITGTVTTNVGSNTITGTSDARFDQEIATDDELMIGNTLTRIVRVTSSNTAETRMTFDTDASGLTVTKTGISQVWNDRFLKAYATALIKKNWGMNLKKFGNVQLPGGVVLNGQTIYDEADAEIQKLENDMEILNVLPNDFLMG
jgi:hypothetical protein